MNENNPQSSPATTSSANPVENFSTPGGGASSLATPAAFSRSATPPGAISTFPKVLSKYGGRGGRNQSSSEGDILIGSSNPPAKKSKKPILIAAIILLLLTAGIAAAVFLLPKSRTASGDSATNFNRFASFVTTGHSSDAFPVEDFSYSQHYAVETAMLTNDAQFFDAANQLLQDFLDTTHAEEQSRLQALIDECQANWRIVYNRAKMLFADKNQIFNYYFANGYAAALERAKAEYGLFEEPKTTYTDTIRQAYLNYDLYIIESIQLAEAAGCVSSDNSFDERCVIEKVPLYIAPYGDYDSVQLGIGEAEQIINNALASFLQNNWDIAEELSK